MTDKLNSETPPPSPNSSQNESARVKSDKVKSAETIPPEIAAFFDKKPVAPATFFKAIRDANVKHFTEHDEATAYKLMQENDPNGSRLWLLMSQAKLPSAVDYWIWKAAQSRLGAVTAGAVDIETREASQILNGLIRFAQHYIDSEALEKKKAGVNWLRIGISWLIEKRQLTPWNAIEQASPLFFAKHADGIKAAKRLIIRGKHQDFRTALVISSLSQAMVANIEKEFNIERRTAKELREQLSDASAELDALRAKIGTLNSDLANMSTQLADAREELKIERQHRGHDFTELNAHYNLLLKNRIAPLLQEAIEALEVTDIQPRIAIKRMKSVLTIIDEAEQ